MRCSVFSLWLALLLPAGAATTPVFQFNESWVEQVKAVRDECDTLPCPVYYDLVANNSASFKLTIPWAGFDASTLNGDTMFSLRLGDWQFQRTLGEALNFQPGATNATFVETGEDAAGRAVTLSRVFVKWTASSLVVTGYDRALIPSIVAGNHLDNNGSFREWVPGEVMLGDFDYARQIFTTGTASVRTVTAGTGDARQQYFLSTVTVSGSADFTRPTATITYPLSGLRWFSNSIALRGTARDNSGVTAVLVRVGNGEFQTATGTNAWTNLVALAPGTNVIQVKAIDADTNESALATTRVIFVVTNALTLAIHPPGSGRVTGVAHGQSLEVGRAYRTAATPLGITNLFAGWTGDWPGSNATLAFVMQSNMTLVANFAPNPFLARVATYAGLCQPELGGEVTRTNVGAVQLTLTSKGGFSGKVVRAHGTHTFTGTFDLSGAATVVAKRLYSPPITVALKLDVAGNDGVTGFVTDGVSTSPFRAGRVAASGLAGRYNFILSGSDNPASAPGGSGAAAAIVAASNTLTASGYLGDGTPLATAGYVTRTGEWPLFAALHSGRGFVAGWAQFDTNAQPTSLVGTNILWLRPPVPTSRVYPAGFFFQTRLTGARHFAPTAGQMLVPWTNGVLHLSAGNLPTSLTNPIVINGLKVSFPAGNSATLSVALQATTGDFTGSFRRPPLNTLTSFRGKWLRAYGWGAGWFTGTNESGLILIEPAPRP